MISLFGRALKGAAVTALGLFVAAPVAVAAAVPVEVKASLDKSVLRAGEKQTAYLRVSVQAAKRPSAQRAPMNIALVIDRSGSMSSDRRIDNARKAAQLAVDRLGRDDILAVVSYDDKVEIEVPSTKVTDAESIKDKIGRLKPRGSTAIHAGLLAGAEEIRKFKSKERVNRIILLSDGLANVGPSKASDFVSLGKELASEGITVSTLGLGTGYNEDLMSGLARAADGGHAFVQESADLANFIAKEFDDTLGIVGQQAEIIFTLNEGASPVRTLGRTADISGNKITYKVGALFGGADQILVAEVAVQALSAAEQREIAKIEVTYTDPATGKRVTASGVAQARFSDDREASAKSSDPLVEREVATLLSREARQEAVKLRDEGKTEEARRKFDDNAKFLSAKKAALPAAAQEYQPLNDEINASAAAAAPAAQSSEGWAKERKAQRYMDSNKAGSASKY
ncbi:MAG: VWA domain-containing protein [Hyphomicrobiaceae bacterium]